MRRALRAWEPKGKPRNCAQAALQATSALNFGSLRRRRDGMLRVDRGVRMATSDIELRRHAEALWRFHAKSDAVERPDAIVCLGSYDLRVAHRAADLALAHKDAAVVVTGAYGNWRRGVFDATEAEVFGRVLAARGVPAGRVMLETRATN